VRVVRREPERAIDARLQLLRDDVLEAIGFVMDVVDVHAQGLGEVQLEQAVMPNDLERDALAGVGEMGATVRLVRQQVERRELLHHRGRRRGSDAEVLRERADRHAALSGLQLEDRLQVVLDRLAQQW